MLHMITTLLLVLFITGCAHKSTDPGGVAYDFWLAEKKSDIDHAAELTLKKDTERVKLHPKIKISDIEFGDPKIEGDLAEVPTTLTLAAFSPMGDEKAKVDFETKMRKTEEGWRVDMFETKKAFYLAVGKTYARTLGQELASSIQNALGDTEQIKGIFGQLVKGLQKALDAQKAPTD